MTTLNSLLHPIFTFQEATVIKINGTTEFKNPGDTVTYWRKIRIPIIQRDYAEGRQNPDVRRKITNFLKQMLDVIYGDKANASLDFIYGYVQDEKGFKCDLSQWDQIQNITFAFEPLDGQQRLTTLFLLYWVLGRESDLIDPRDKKSLFTYATRESSTNFCNALVQQNAKKIISDWKVVVKTIKEENEEAKKTRESEDDKYRALLKYPEKSIPSLSLYIQNQTWFKWNWRTDPTICSMLNVIDLLMKMIDSDNRGGYDKVCSNNKNLDNIRFSLLDELECNGQLLFVKMNARGKELSEFDLSKSELEEDIEKQIVFQESSLKEKTEWTHKVDGNWLDYCWHKITDNWTEDRWETQSLDEVEDYLLRLIKRVIGKNFFDKRKLLRKCQNQLSEDQTKSADQIKISNIFIQDFINSFYDRSNYCSNIIHRYEDYVDEMRKVGVQDYVTIKYDDVIKDIDSLLFCDNGKWHDIDEYTHDFTILHDYITNDTIDYLQRLLFDALVLFTTNIADVSTLSCNPNLKKDLIDWLRFVLHMFRNENRTQRIDDQDTFESTINELNNFVQSWKSSHKTFNQFISKTPPALFTIEPDRYKEEQLKANLKIGANGKDWEKYFEDLETKDKKHMLGQYHAPLSWSKNDENGLYDLEMFKDYTTRLHMIFEKSEFATQLKCMLSLLAYKDYLFDSPNNGFASLRNFIATDRDFSWKRFLRDPNHVMFKGWLDEWNKSSLTLDKYLDQTIANATKKLKSSDWRYFLLRTSVDGLCELIRRTYSSYYNIRLYDGHPYMVHAKTSRGDKQYDIIMVYLADRLKSHPQINHIDYNEHVRSDYTELYFTTLKQTSINVKNYHDNTYHVKVNSNEYTKFNDFRSMILFVERIINF